MKRQLTMLAASAVLNGFAAMPQLEPAFSAAQIEKGAPKLVWTRAADGWERTVLTERDAGRDLAGVTLSRKATETAQPGSAPFRTVTYRLENGTKELRYASFGWRTSFTIRDGNDRNWFPTTDNVIDLTVQSSFWGYYTKPGNWQFSLVEPWFAAYNPGHRVGYAFLFDFDTLSAAYGANDMKVRGVLFDGGMLPAGAKIEVATRILEVKGLSALATVNEEFAAGFAGPATCPCLEVLPFRALALKGTVKQTEVTGAELGAATVNATLAPGKATNVCVFKSRKPSTQTVLSATLNSQPPTLNPQSSTLNPQPSTLNPQSSTLNPQPSTYNPQPTTHNPQPSTHNPQPSTYTFEYFRENGFRMASLPMVPATWTHHRAMPPKRLAETAAVRQEAKDKALLLFGFYANFFRFEAMFPELTFTTVPATPQGIGTIPPASTIGEYRYVFLGDVNEESVRPMLARLAAYVKNGGTLVVGGGPFAYGCGGYTGTFLGEMLPVTTKRFDCLPACASDADGRTAVAFEGCDAKVFWIQRDTPKPGAEILLRTAAGDPLLVKGTYGRGRVFAFLGAPLGDEARDAKAFWNDNAAYLSTMKDLLK